MKIFLEFLVSFHNRLLHFILYLRQEELNKKTDYKMTVDELIDRLKLVGECWF